MTWWLVRIYLCTALLNFIFAIPQSRVKQKSRTINIPNIGRNTGDSVKARKSAEDAETVLPADKPEKQNDFKNNNENDKEKRSLSAGDSFTPSDMLPIAEKLFNRVDDPGKGHGFVSSTNSPQELADKLFEAFFFTTKRIIFLKNEDIPGIDALQALALSGETVDSQVEGVTEAADTMYEYIRSKLERMKPKRSKYKLVTKIITEGKQGTTRKPNRRRIKLNTKYLNKKRHLIINKRRNNRFKPVSKTVSKASESMASSVFERGNPGVTKNQTCHWKYECSNMLDLDTCRLHSVCAKDTSKKSTDEISIKRNSDKHTMTIERFRKMLRIFTVDEELEKILKSRNLQLRPSNATALERAESLAEYFNKIIVDDQYFSRTTESLSRDNVTL